DLANRHPRIDILQPGPGVGGHCIAVDPWFIAYSAPKESLLIQTARKINDEKPGFVVKKILAAIKEISSLNMIDPSKINICFFGITFKADVDDLRESPAKNIVNMISEKTECNIFIIEPNIKNIYDNKFIHIDAKEACEIGDLAVLLVDHKEFIDLDTSMFKSVIDTKGIASKKKDNYD
ncbi:MAG: UDP-N-acetyl-D-mannosamine dehydrogenase, partial [Euryarchaeota archaeon]|nr:UDP-N-acetyl-D-mannosamine dehydrogenase [Euryarchaeota archaeon]